MTLDFEVVYIGAVALGVLCFWTGWWMRGRSERHGKAYIGGILSEWKKPPVEMGYSHDRPDQKPLP